MGKLALSRFLRHHLSAMCAAAGGIQNIVFSISGLLAVTILLSFQSPIALAEPEPPAPSIEDTELFREAVRVESEEFFASIKDKIPEIQHAWWNRIVDEVAVKFLQLQRAKKIIVTFGGKKVAIAVGTASFVNEFIITSALWAIGYPQLIPFVEPNPLGLEAGGLVYYLEIRKRTRSLKKELGVSDLKPLNELRDKLVGYKAGYWLATELLNTAEDAAEKTIPVEILSKRKAKAASFVRAVDIPTMETIIRNSGREGDNYLAMITRHKQNPLRYAHEMLCFIKADQGTMEAFLKAANKGFIEGGLSEADSQIRKAVFRFEEALREVDTRVKMGLEIESALKKQIKSGKVDRSKKGKLSSFAKRRIKELGALKWDLMRMEYRYLHSIAGQRAGVEAAVTVEDQTYDGPGMEGLRNRLQTNLRLIKGMETLAKQPELYSATELLDLEKQQGIEIREPLRVRIVRCLRSLLGFAAR